MNKNTTTFDIEIKQLRTKINELENELISPLKEKIIELEKQKEDFIFEPIIKKILNGEVVGRRSHYCSPFYEFNYKSWKEYGWDSAEHFIKSVNPSWYSFNTDKILFVN